MQSTAIVSSCFSLLYSVLFRMRECFHTCIWSVLADVGSQQYNCYVYWRRQIDLLSGREPPAWLNASRLTSDGMW